MKELKKIVNISPNIYIDFERPYVCYKSEAFKEIHLTQQEVQILKFLCLQCDNDNNGYVTNEQIFTYLYGQPYKHDGSKPDLNNVTKAMSKLRAKKSGNGEIDIHQIIESDRNGSFKLTLIESPFQSQTEIRNSTDSKKIISEKLAEDFISVVKKLNMLTDDIKVSMIMGTVLPPEIIDKYIEIQRELSAYANIYTSTNPILSQQIIYVGKSFSDFFLGVFNDDANVQEVEERWYDYLENLDKLSSIL